MTLALKCENISKTFGSVQAVDNVSFGVEAGQILALVGPSGCGKTTLLRMIAGFEMPDEGFIQIDGECMTCPVTFVQPENRQVGMVFQDYALFPHLNVRDNISFGLKGNKSDKQKRANELLNLIGLPDYGDRFPHELSGGEQQRVALARTLAPNPRLVLLDEPFSNLDADLRRELRSDVRHILKTLNITTILVTHDQEEAMEIGDQVAVLHSGHLEQIGPTFEVYEQPRTPFVARFLGKADFLPVRFSKEALRTDLGPLPLPKHLPKGQHLHVLVRPEFLEISGQPMDRSVPVEVVTNKSSGHTSVHCLKTPSGRRVHSASLGPMRFPEGSKVYARLNIPQPVVFDEMDEQPYCLFSPEDGPCCQLLQKPGLIQIQPPLEEAV